MEDFFLGDKYRQCLGFFLDVLRNVETGIILLDVHHKEIIFSNNHANDIVSTINIPLKYHDIHALLQGTADYGSESGKINLSNKLRTKNRVFGVTFYNLAGNQNYLCLFLQDITDESRLAAIDEASELMNNIGYVFTGIRHEIGNPINSIKMALTVMQNNINRFSREELEVYISRIYDEVTRMELLLKSFKNFNMFERPAIIDFDIIIFVKNFLKLLEADIDNRKITLDLQLSIESQWAKADKRALQHVLLNVIANAIHGLEDRENGTLCIKCQPTDDTVIELSIIDNGCGMSPDTLGNIFKPFYTTKPSGTGLGLVICKKMLAQMNCGINITSEVNKGSVITMTIPKGEPVREEDVVAVPN